MSVKRGRPNQTALLALIDNLGLEMYSWYRAGDSVYIDADRVRRTFSGEHFPVSAATTAEMERR